MGSGTSTPVFIAIFTFYIFLFALMGLINESFHSAYATPTISAPPTTNFGSSVPVLGDIVDFLIAVAVYIWAGFSILISGISFSITGIPVIFSTMIFLPLSMTIIFMLANLARGNE